MKESTNYQGSQTSNDEVALIKLYEQYRRPIHSYAYRLLGHQEDADDITQEVFIRACSAWEGLSDHDRLSSWLYRIATNLCLDLMRRRKRLSWWSLSHRWRQEGDSRKGELVDEENAYFLADDGGIPEVAERELIRLALARIPEEYAAVLILNAAQGIPYQEVAAIMGTSPNAAATRISRAKKMFMEQYKRLNKLEYERQEGRK